MGNFTIDEIKDAWKKYDKGNIFGLFKEGKWVYYDTMPGGPLGGTKAELRKLSDAYEFPEYLEKRYKT